MFRFTRLLFALSIVTLSSLPAQAQVTLTEIVVAGAGSSPNQSFQIPLPHVLEVLYNGCLDIPNTTRVQQCTAAADLMRQNWKKVRTYAYAARLADDHPAIVQKHLALAKKFQEIAESKQLEVEKILAEQ